MLHPFICFHAKLRVCAIKGLNFKLRLACESFEKFDANSHKMMADIRNTFLWLFSYNCLQNIYVFQKIIMCLCNRLYMSVWLLIWFKAIWLTRLSFKDLKSSVGVFLHWLLCATCSPEIAPTCFIFKPTVNKIISSHEENRSSWGRVPCIMFNDAVISLIY